MSSLFQLRRRNRAFLTSAKTLTSTLCSSRRLLRRPLIPYPLHLAAGHLLPPAVVELGGTRVGVAGHVLGHLDRAAVFQKDGDAGCPPAVVTDRRRDPC